MSKNTERIEQYLKHIRPTEPEAGPHRTELRRQVLGEIERRQTMSARNRAWRVGLAIAAVVCGGAIATAVGVKIYRYQFQGQDDKGHYVFETGPEVVYEGVETAPNGTERHVQVVTSRTVSMSPDHIEGSSVEQAQLDLEEIDRLREENDRDLIRVIDTEVAGQSSRACVYRYTLGDGRAVAMGENDRENDGGGVRALSASQWQELSDLARADEGESLETYEEPIGGATFVFEKKRFILTDGTEVLRSRGTAKAD